LRYAANTEVSVERSKGEIERLLRRYGATEMVSGWKSEKAMLQFRMSGRVIRFTLKLPSQSDFVKTPTGRTRKNPAAVMESWEQGCRQRWRALTLAIKAKLESVESEIEEFETAFMGQIVLPDGSTVAEQILPSIEAAYTSGKMPARLLLEY
jgi:hypothetical protein